ncbi:MAG: DUF427 domain-containing protein [Actinomycetota bacterium]
MATATVDGTVIAQSDATVVVEGNHYFPPDSIDWQFFSEIDRTSGCPWKGTANYYDVSVGDQVLAGVAWTYHEPKEAAAEIKDHVAFYPGVTVAA